MKENLKKYIISKYAYDKVEIIKYNITGMNCYVHFIHDDLKYSKIEVINIWELVEHLIEEKNK